MQSYLSHGYAMENFRHSARAIYRIVGHNKRIFVGLLAFILILSHSSSRSLASEQLSNDTNNNSHDDHYYEEVKTNLFHLKSDLYNNYLSQSPQLDQSNDIYLNLNYWCHIESSEAISAVKRAKTSSCKQQLIDAACKLQSANLYKHEPYHKLRNHCPVLDRDGTIHEKYEHLGCYKLQLKEISQKLVILRTNLSESQCIEGCYKYGYSLAALDNEFKCYCSIHFNWLESHRNGLYREPKTCQNSQYCSEENCSLEKAFDFYATGSYLHPRFNLTRQKKSQTHEIKIVFLLTLNGRAIRQVKRLIKNLYSERHIFYIHIDSRDEYMYRELLTLEKKYKNVVLERNRFSTIWGGTSLLRMLLQSINHLLTMTHDWDYIINLSESDYNIKPLKSLETYLSSNYGAIFLKSHSLDNQKFIKKQGLDNTFYECEDRMWRLGGRDLPDGIIYTGGSDWFALPRNFCIYIDNDKNLVSPLVELFNQTLLPVESFFHTIAVNSHYCQAIRGENLRISNWQRKQGCRCQHKDVVDWCGCSPLVYRQKDWIKLKTTRNQDLFFSRKFDPTISLEIINLVDTDLLSRHTEYENENSYWQNLIHSFELSTHNHNTIMLSNFATLALASADILVDLSSNLSYFGSQSFRLESVDLYFSNDAFKGFIITYCFSYDRCIQLFVKKDVGGKSNHYNSDCFSKEVLKVLEVSSDFDVKEKIFRNYGGILGAHSDLILYHSWHIEGQHMSPETHRPMINSTSMRMRYKWINPSGIKEHLLDVNLRPKIRSSNFAQALQVKLPKPLNYGQWTIKLETESNKHCLDYNFLILPDTAEGTKKLPQLLSDFMLYFKVIETCFIKSEKVDVNQPLHQSNLSRTKVDESKWPSHNCQHFKWSTLANDPKSLL